MEIAFNQQEEKPKPTAFCIEINTIFPTKVSQDEKLDTHTPGVRKPASWLTRRNQWKNF